MNFFTHFAAIAWLVGVATADCQFIAGNNYCNKIQHAVYSNVGAPGSYNRVTSFNSDGTCSYTPQSYSGSLSPLDEEVSLHFRGPVHLKQLAVYTQGGSSNTKRDVEPEEEKVEIVGRHGHHQHEKRAFVTHVEYVTKFINGDGSPEPSAAPVDFAAGNSDSAPAPAPAPSVETSSPPAAAAPSSPAAASSEQSSSPAASPSSSASSPASSAAAPSQGSNSGNGWQQTGYYNAESGSSNGLVFLNNMGGAGSGVFDFTFGNSISYATSDAQNCASSPEVLADKVIPSNKEIIIMSDSKCSGDDCGFYREGIPAYHGFGGNTKMFLFEFSMPSDGPGAGFNFDMPAIWLLNAQIPRTLQYGKKECSCWASGCGEFDVFEVLNSGNNFLTSHLHSNQGSDSNYGGGGTPDFFQRPTDGTMKAALIFDGNDETISIVQLDDNTSFDQSISLDTIKNWTSKSSGGFTNVHIN